MGLNFWNNDKSVHAICTYTMSSIVLPARPSTSFSLSTHTLFSSFIVYFFWYFARLRINADPSRQVQGIANKNGVAKRRGYRSARHLDHLSSCLRRGLRKRSPHGKNSRHRQDHC